jgi:hypothetical protein
MKIARYLFLSTLILTGSSVKLIAQADTLRNPDQFIFPEFFVGVAKMLNGEKIILNFNYNIVTEKLVFMQKDQIYDVVNTSVIDTVYMEGRKFIPSGKIFLEVLTNGKSTFFIQHKGSVKKPPRPAAYGGTSEVSSSTYVNNLKLGNDRFRMPTDSELVIEPGSLYWIRKDQNMNLVTGKKSLLKIFEDKKSEVRGYMAKSKFDAENPDHLNGLVMFYNSLP